MHSSPCTTVPSLLSAEAVMHPAAMAVTHLKPDGDCGCAPSSVSQATIVRPSLVQDSDRFPQRWR